HTLTRYGVSGRADAVAVGIAGCALLLSVRQRRIGIVAGVLFALAAWVKPNVLGMAAGTFAIELATRRLRAWQGIAGAAGAFLTVLGVVHYASHGLWFEHMRGSMVAPLNANLWVDQMQSRLPFFLLPMGFAAYAAWRAWKTRRDRGSLLVLGAIVGSFVWAVYTHAKIGSASNYWMEPAVAMVVGLARAGMPALSVRGARVVAAVAVVQALWVAPASVRSALEILEGAAAKKAALTHVREACNSRPDEAVMGDDQGFEFEANGRVLEMPIQLMHLVRNGAFPLQTWIDDVQREEVTCVILADDLLERPLDDVHVEHDLFPPQMREVLRARFMLRARKEGLWIYGLRERR
ncbi:MAG TPA: hypothetical protein VNO21_20625, partial [Polyangiaceae bacterium]|nr:hypothetical protein [Polyangiaceae bacterium]